jgi:hypothetical protein
VTALDEVSPGDSLELSLKIREISQPVILAEAVRIAGPRPRIAMVERSLVDPGTVTLEEGEIPEGSVTSFVIRVEHADGPLAVDLRCGEEGQTLTLATGQQTAQARLENAGANLFLYLDPAGLGPRGCRLSAAVRAASTGTSDVHALGRLVRLPRIDQFTLTDQSLREGFYLGTLTGENLQLIEKVGWDAETGYPVEAIPSSLGGDFRKQTLRIALPWPAPTPHAAVYVWLHGESKGRATRARF